MRRRKYVDTKEIYFQYVKVFQLYYFLGRLSSDLNKANQIIL